MDQGDDDSARGSVAAQPLPGEPPPPTIPKPPPLPTHHTRYGDPGAGRSITAVQPRVPRTWNVVEHHTDTDGNRTATTATSPDGQTLTFPVLLYQGGRNGTLIAEIDRNGTPRHPDTGDPVDIDQVFANLGNS